MAFIIGILGCAFPSCKHEGKYDHSDITLFYICTENLFDFFTPKMTIVNGDGSRQEIILSKEDFKYDVNMVYPDGMSEDEKVQGCYCTIRETLKGTEGNFKAIVSYIPVGDWNMVDTKKLMGDGITAYSVEVFCDDGHSIKKKEARYGMNLSYVSETGIHLTAHKTITFDLNYKIVAYDDQIDFDGKCTIATVISDHHTRQ